MASSSDDRIVQLQGDLTHSAVTRCIVDSLAASLHRAVLCGDRYLQIDCTRVGRIDAGGLHLLTAWLQSARTQGIEPLLINLSDGIK